MATSQAWGKRDSPKPDSLSRRYAKSSDNAGHAAVMPFFIGGTPIAGCAQAAASRGRGDGFDREGRSMTRCGLLSLAFIVAAAASAAAQTTSSAEKNCIFAAAQRLPPIPGLVITGSRVSGLPNELKGKGKSDMAAVLVEIDARAAAQDATFLFLCATAPGRPFFADPLGIAK